MTQSSRRLKEQVREAASDLPIHAARLAMTGVGQALSLTDRVRRDYREARTSGVGPVLDRLRHDAEDLAEKVIGQVSDRVNGHTADGRTDARDQKREAPADSEIAVGKPAPSTPRPVHPRPTDREAAPQKTDSGATARPTAEERTTPRPAAGPSRSGAGADLPVPNYDSLTVASLRARLRVLDADEVGRLRDYERTHEARAEVLRMFENRIAKLENGG